VTAKVLTNVKKIHDEASDLDGFEDLNEADQARITKAWEDGHVADEDIPESARKPAKEGDEDDDEDDDEDKPKKKKKATKAAEPKAKAEPRKRAPKKKKACLFCVVGIYSDTTHGF
jgi:hypothetical protein